MTAMEAAHASATGGVRRPARSWRRRGIGSALARGVAGVFAVAAVLAASTAAIGAAPLPVVVPGQGRIVEGDAGTRVLEIPVTLSEPSTETVTAQWVTIFGPGVQPPAPATPGVDFSAASGTATFGPGSTTTTIEVTVIGDVVGELDEWVVVAFHDPTDAVLGGYWGLGSGIIEDDDTPPVVVPGSGSGWEGDAGPRVLEIPVTLSAPSTETVTVRWDTIFGPGVRPPAPAEPGTDYTAAGGTVTFPPGTTSAVVEITVHGDLAPEPAEWVVVAFHHATNATIGGYWGLGSAIIDDDDTPPRLRPTHSSGVIEGDTGPTTLLVPVTLSAPTPRTVTASWSTRQIDLEGIPTATEGVDYVAATGTVTFPPGVTTATVPVTVLGDPIDEPDEAVFLVFADPVNATLGPSPIDTIAVGTIHDDD